MNPLWRAAPLVLRRYPGVLAALVAAAALLTLAAAAGPLFVSASASAAVGDELRRLTPFGAGAYVRVTGPVAPEQVEAFGDPTFAERTAALEEATEDLPGRGGIVATILGPELDATGPADGAGADLEVRLLARTGALEHVRRLEGGDGPGLWLADTVAEQLGLEPGDRVLLGPDASGGRVAVPVAGLYRSLANEPRTPFWRSLESEIHPAPPAYAAQPTFAIGDVETVTETATRLGLERADFRWEVPLEPRSLSLADAERVARGLEGLGAALGDERDPLFELFVCRRCFRGIRAEFSTGLPRAVDAARASAATVRGPVDLLANAGSLVALAVVGAVGAFALARRRVEVAALVARGTSPGSAGARLALEALLPVLAGAVLGVGAAYLLVTVFGPDGSVDAEGLGDAVRAAALRVPVALALLALVGAAWTARLERAGGGVRRRRIPLPWELAALALAAFCLARLVAGEAFTETGETGVTEPSAYLLLFPLFLVAGVAGLGARLLRRAVAAGRRRSAGASEPVYLAVHRLAAARALLALLVTAAALALGLFAYAEAVVSSYRSTVHAASLLGTGSDIAGLTSYERDIPDLPVPVT
ncbi:MAG TPA: hypothetical protein VK896_15155, partial [Gaiellaceae bacterium]|nr:hypothetical protein [Gaiellaceae bacterium]